MLNGFTFDGIHCSYYGVYLKSKNRPPLPNTKDRLEKIPFRNGSYDFGSDLDSRIFELQLSFFADEGMTQFRQKTKDISKWLNPLKGVKPLVFDDEPEVTYFARYSGSINLEQILTLGIFEISFLCPDPLGQIAETVISKEIIITDNTMSINNNGNFETPMIIEVEGRTNTLNPTITIGMNTINYGGTLLNTEKLIIDTDKMTMVKGTTNALALQSGNFPTLLPGANTLTYSDDGNNSAKVTIKYNERCL